MVKEFAKIWFHEKTSKFKRNIISYILGKNPQVFHLSEANFNQDDEGLIDVDDVALLIARILGKS